MQKRALITGINGMDGSHLADLLLEKGYKVFGLERRVSTPVRRNTEHLVGKITFLTGDLTDQRSLMTAIETSNPDEIYNLAAQSFVGSSWGIPNQTSEVNAIGVLNILEATRQVKPAARFYQASTSEMYGNHSVEYADEDTPFNPRSPYGVAKLFAHHMTINYRESYGMFTSCGILFNHESERRGLEFVTRKITDGVARIATGKADHILLGNLLAKRDWGYSPDYVEAMWRILQHKNPTEFVVATGGNHSVEEFVALAFSVIGQEYWWRFIVQDDALMRPADIYNLKGSFSKVASATGWIPTTEFEEMVRKMVLSDIERHKNAK